MLSCFAVRIGFDAQLNRLSMSKLSKLFPYAAVALVVYVFFAFAYGATLRYGEQYQLFQATIGYPAKRTS